MAKISKILSTIGRKLQHIAGLPLVYTGVIILALSYFTGLSHVKPILVTGLLLIVAGIATYVWKVRHQSQY